MRKFYRFSLFAMLGAISPGEISAEELRGDFDCDGTGDVAVSSGNNLFDVSLGNGATVEGLPVGEAGDTVLAGDSDGNACHDLYAYSARGMSTVKLPKASAPVTVFGLPCDKKLSNNDGSGGFVNNPENSKGKAKLVAPNRFTGKIKSVYIAKNGKIIEKVPAIAGNEWGNRQRFYSKKAPRQYGKNIVWVIDAKDNLRYCIPVPDPSKRYD